MLDTKLGNSQLKRIIIKFTQKYLYRHISANQLTFLGFLLGLIGAILIGIHGFFQIPSGYQQFQTTISESFMNQGFVAAWETFLEKGPFGWNWMLGDTLLLFGAIFLILSFVMDVFDGAVARLTEPTIFGGIFDIFSDRLVELLFLIAIISTDPPHLLWPGLISFAAIVECITIFLLIGGAVDKTMQNNMTKEQKVIYYSTGLMERTETFLFILFSITFSPVRPMLLWIFAILVWITAFQRFIHAYRLFKK